MTSAEQPTQRIPRPTEQALDIANMDPRLLAMLQQQAMLGMLGGKPRPPKPPTVRGSARPVGYAEYTSPVTEPIHFGKPAPDAGVSISDIMINDARETARYLLAQGHAPNYPAVTLGEKPPVYHGRRFLIGPKIKAGSEAAKHEAYDPYTDALPPLTTQHTWVMDFDRGSEGNRVESHNRPASGIALTEEGNMVRFHVGKRVGNGIIRAHRGLIEPLITPGRYGGTRMPLSTPDANHVLILGATVTAEDLQPDATVAQKYADNPTAYPGVVYRRELLADIIGRDAYAQRFAPRTGT